MAQEASSSTKSKMISLKTYDGDVFEIEVTIAKQMQTIQAFINENEAVDAIPLPNVSAKDLTKIIEYCKKYIGEDITKDFEAEFVKDMSNKEVKALLLATNYLNVNRLFEFLSKTLAKRLENKSVEYIRDFFGIDNDYTPEEEAKLREERAWSFRGIKDED